MSTSKVLKSRTPHQVKMPEGAKNAQRKTTKAPVEKSQVELPSTRKVKVQAAPVKASKSVKATPINQVTKALPRPKPVKAAEPVAVAVPASIAKKTRAKAKSQAQEKPAVVDSSPKPTAPAPAPVTRATVPEHELWEADSPVMRRISQLRTRNAQLSEQVQRLKKPA